MLDEVTARPVSGEIMTGATIDAPFGRPRDVSGDIIDADYEIVSPVDKAESRAAGFARAAPVLGGMEMLRRPDGQPVARAAARGGPIFWTTGVGLIAAAFWASGGHAVIGKSLLPAGQPAAMLSISGVSSRIDASGPEPVLYVDGEAANGGKATVPLPPLEIRVTGNDGRVTRYNLGTSDRAMKPGEKFAFSSRLDLPKNGVKTVSVAFSE